MTSRTQSIRGVALTSSAPDELGSGETAGEAKPRGLVVDGLRRRSVGPVSFEAAPGEFVVVTGPAAGMSTLAGLVAGFDRPDSGRVLLDGRDVAAMSEHELERRVGWLTAVLSRDATIARRPPVSLVVGCEPPSSARWWFYPLIQRLTGFVWRAIVVVATRDPRLEGLADRVVRV